VLEASLVDLAIADERATPAAEVAQVIGAVIGADDLCVCPGDHRIVDADLAGLAAPDDRVCADLVAALAREFDQTCHVVAL
jgi:hypothetical protein